MRTLFTSAILLLVGHVALLAQNNGQPDTLLLEPVVGNPIEFMLSAPSGFDELWVNYDEDAAIGYCVSGGETPLGWFIERDFGFINPEETENDCFTSCSYLKDGVANKNWLILPPVLIPDETYQLCWRSLVTEGPAYMDGYKVLVSTASNLPSSMDFQHNLFTAAETIKPIIPGNYTIYPDDYIFSDGYIHANGFTDTNYYFLLAADGPLRGRLEPHCVSLSEFSGETIYIAFLHDSQDDSQLQLDDIIVTNTTTSVSHLPSANFLEFNALPNPATDHTYVQWSLKQAEPGQLQLLDFSGKLIQQHQVGAYTSGSFYLPLAGLPGGVYQCVLQTASGYATRKVVKM
jgi:hypothetical protein